MAPVEKHLSRALFPQTGCTATPTLEQSRKVSLKSRAASGRGLSFSGRRISRDALSDFFFPEEEAGDQVSLENSALEGDGNSDVGQNQRGLSRVQVTGGSYPKEGTCL